MAILSGRLDHVALQVRDLDQSLQFYTGVLGLKLDFRKRDEAHGETFAFLQLEGGRLELLQLLDPSRNPQRPSTPREPWCPHVALATENLDEALAEATAAGVTVLKGPMDIPDLVRWAYLADPDGNVLELVQWLKPDNAG